MTTRQTVYAPAVLLILLSSASAGEPAPETAEIRERIARALPYLEKGGISWMKKRKCVSCHRVSFLVWSHREAKRVGVSVDGKKIEEWTNWSLKKLLEKRKEDADLVGSRNLDGLRQMILARDPIAAKPDKQRAAAYVKFTEMMVAGQRKNGSWKAAGQLPFQKRPKPETDAVSTMWAVAALAEIEQTENVKSAAKRAAAFLKSAKPGKSVEWFAVRLLAAIVQEDSSKTKMHRDALLRLQNPDGGWPWLLGGKSDAMATGQVLYVLSRDADRASAGPIRRAQSFLLKSQRKDGSWAVHGTKAKKQKQPQETSNYWGTAWAVIGVGVANCGNLTWMEVRDAMKAGKKTAIVATGGIEQNGPYLVTGKHNVVLRATTEAIARKLGDALVAPIVPFVPEGNISPPSLHMKYPGTISVTEETYRRLLTDICASLKTHGFETIVLIGDSGGNQKGLKAVAEALTKKWQGSQTRIVYIPEYYDYGAVARFVADGGIKQVSEGLHDDFAMTAMMMSVDPASVRTKQRIAAGKFHINGVDLAPARKTVEWGRKIIAFRADATVRAIRKATASR
eukprot:g21449.t1